jgi:hypothetical protein
MTTQRKGFWRGFTWKRFLKFSLLFLICNIVIELAGEYFDGGKVEKRYFTMKSVGLHVIKASLLGLVCAIWFEPGIDDKKRA